MEKLSNGYQIPNLCVGSDVTYIHSKGIKRCVDNFKCKIKIYIKKNPQIEKRSLYLPKIVRTSYDYGCRMFDTSRAYGASEFVIGNTLNTQERTSYYLITKLSNSDQYNGKVIEGCQKSLEELQTSYIDLYLMHWPVTGLFVESWKKMEDLYLSGKCKAIGVCNFNIHHLEELKEHARIMPMVNQIECHPLFTQEELRKYCNENNIRIMAYTSTARMDQRLTKTCLVDIAHKYNKNIAQVILKWHQQLGNIPIVSSNNIQHILSNIDINDFTLTDEEITLISKININSRLRYDPDNCDFTKL